LTGDISKDWDVIQKKKNQLWIFLIYDTMTEQFAFDIYTWWYLRHNVRIKVLNMANCAQEIFKEFANGANKHKIMTIYIESEYDHLIYLIITFVH